MNNFCLSNTFYRLAKKDRNGTYDIYDFHTSVSGNCWIQGHQRVTLNQFGVREGDCCHLPISVIFVVGRSNGEGKAFGNRKYTELIEKYGFAKVGKFEQDIYGRERAVK